MRLFGQAGFRVSNTVGLVLHAKELTVAKV
jgi:hypothetical protein